MLPSSKHAFKQMGDTSVYIYTNLPAPCGLKLALPTQPENFAENHFIYGFCIYAIK